MMLKITAWGEKILINTANILTVETEDDVTVIHMVDSARVPVPYTLDEVCEILNDAK